MLKYILLATTMVIAAPAMAQVETTQDATAAQPATTPESQPATTDTVPADTAAAPAQTAPVESTAQTAPAPAEGQPAATAAASPAPAQQPVTSETQIADVVSKEFGGYDKDANGALDQTEFATWMTALRTASEPGYKSDTPAATKWVGQAFTTADTDKSKSINQGELTMFLTPKSAS